MANLDTTRIALENEAIVGSTTNFPIVQKGRTPTTYFRRSASFSKSAATTTAQEVVLIGDLSDTTTYSLGGTTNMIVDYIHVFANGGGTTTSAFNMYFGFVNALSTAGFSMKVVQTVRGGVSPVNVSQDRQIQFFPNSIKDSAVDYLGTVLSGTAASTASAPVKIGGTTATLTAGDFISYIDMSGSALAIDYDYIVGLRAE